ncbi:hypothetical protein U1Q18_028114, partial [Sarracenia purpurea var. burkii]
EAPFAVYEVDKVLVPKEFSEAKALEAPAPPPPTVYTIIDESGRIRVGLGLVAGFGLICMGLIS